MLTPDWSFSRLQQHQCDKPVCICLWRPAFPWVILLCYFWLAAASLAIISWFKKKNKKINKTKTNQNKQKTHKKQNTHKQSQNQKRPIKPNQTKRKPRPRLCVISYTGAVTNSHLTAMHLLCFFSEKCWLLTCLFPAQSALSSSCHSVWFPYATDNH